MIVLWVGLLVLHGGYSQLPVITAELGEPATVTCLLPEDSVGSEELTWYKQRVGHNLKVVVTAWTQHFQYGPEFHESKLTVIKTKSFSNLTILKTTEEDEGIYHCAFREAINSVWRGTYVLVKGNTERTSNYSVVQASTASDPVRPGDSVTLQCSVVSDPDTQTCPGRLSVYWFRAGSDASHPGVIYADGASDCEQRSESVKSCRHRFSNVSSSDAGTYHCAVATCGQILFGEGTKLLIDQELNGQFVAVVTLTVCLTISVIGHIVFICCRTPISVCEQCKGTEHVSTPAKRKSSSPPAHDITESVDLNYAALNFSGGKVTRGRRKKDLKTEDCVYSGIKRGHNSQQAVGLV